jgi:hypothetical protein
MGGFQNRSGVVVKMIIKISIQNPNENRSYFGILQMIGLGVNVARIDSRIIKKYIYCHRFLA